MPLCKNYYNVLVNLCMGDSYSPLKYNINLQICIPNSGESDLHARSSADNQRNLALFLFNLPYPPNSQNYGILACRYTHHHPRAAI